MIKKTDTDLAEQYIKGQLTENELMAFQERLTKEPRLREQVALLEDIRWSIGQNAIVKENQLKAQFRQKYQKEIRQKYTYLFVILGIILLSLIGLFWFINRDTEEKIYADLYLKDQIPLSTQLSRGAGTIQSDSILTMGLLYLDQGKIKEGKGVFSSLMLSQPNNPNYQYYYIVALFQNREYQQAYDLISNIKKFYPNNVFSTQLDYYTAGCLLKLENCSSAIKYFQRIETRQNSPISGRIRRNNIIERLSKLCSSK